MITAGEGGRTWWGLEFPAAGRKEKTEEKQVLGKWRSFFPCVFLALPAENQKSFKIKVYMHLNLPGPVTQRCYMHFTYRYAEIPWARKLY